MLQQADIVPAMFLLGDEFSLEQKRRNFEYCDRLTTGDSCLSACAQSIIAAEIGNQRQALEYFDYALLMDLANVAGNASDGVHIASAAGVWSALVSGSAACATSTATCPSPLTSRVTGTSSRSRCGSATGSSGCS